MKRTLLIMGALTVAACSKTEAPADRSSPPADHMVPTESGQLDGAGSDVVCPLGSKQPSAPLINPDNPDYQDATWSKADVQAKFAAAKAQNAASYRAYKAAYGLADVLPCAFCTCGCSVSQGHLSAVDCFKDMHGFS